MLTMWRRRRQRNVGFAEFHMFAFGNREEITDSFDSFEDAERSWLEVRDVVLDSWAHEGRPSAWWVFEPGVPDDLRSGPDGLRTEADREEWRRIDAGRRAYLASLDEV